MPLWTLAQQFRTAGHDLYLVGGSVRDALLGRLASSDIDMTTDATPDAIKRITTPTRPRAIVLVGERFGTVRLHYALPDDAATAPQAATAAITPTVPDDLIIEITTYRSERYDPESRKPEVAFGTNLQEDLLRRDFTINAMARDPLTGGIIDPFGGQADLEARVIRAVGDDPEQRFADDPLRLLRAVRFAAQLDFTIEPHTAAAIAAQAATLEKISRERVRDEFTKLLVTPRPMAGLRLVMDLGMMPYIVPEMVELRGVSQQPQAVHSKDVYEHVLRVVQNTPPRHATRWAGLLHDIAKPRTRTKASVRPDGERRDVRDARQVWHSPSPRQNRREQRRHEQERRRQSWHVRWRIAPLYGLVREWMPPPRRGRDPQAPWRSGSGSRPAALSPR